MVEKRDGRREPLRAVKIARSIYLAVCSSGEPHDGQVWEVARAVLAALQARPRPVWTAEEIAELVRDALVEAGLPGVARWHERVSYARQRRASAIRSALLG